MQMSVGQAVIWQLQKRYRPRGKCVHSLVEQSVFAAHEERKVTIPTSFPPEAFVSITAEDTGGGMLPTTTNLNARKFFQLRTRTIFVWTRPRLGHLRQRA